jgi:hypothetical protein
MKRLLMKRLAGEIRITARRARARRLRVRNAPVPHSLRREEQSIREVSRALGSD